MLRCRMSLKITRPTVVVTSIPGVNSLSPSPFSFLWLGEPQLDPRVDADLLLAECQKDLVGRRVDAGLDAIIALLVLAELTAADAR